MSNQDKVTIFAAAKKKWEAEATAWKVKQAKTVTGKAHMQVSIEDIGKQK